MNYLSQIHTILLSIDYTKHYCKKIINTVNFDLQIYEDDNIEKWTIIKFFGTLENQTVINLAQGSLNGEKYKAKIFYMSKHKQLGKLLNCSLNINLVFKNYDENIDGYYNMEGSFISDDCKLEVTGNFEYEKVKIEY